MKLGRTTTSGSENQHIDTLIGELSSFKGELIFDGVVRIDGKFEGNVRSAKDGTLIVSESARIIGDVDVPKLILHGAIKGNVRAREALQIGASGQLTGDVEYKVMTLVEGASINGRCNRMTDTAKAKSATAPVTVASDTKAVQAG